MSTVWSTEYMTQSATYWSPGANDGYGGLTFTAPTAITCRWQAENKKFVTVTGNEQVSIAAVYPDRVLQTGGWLYLGTSSAADPRTVDGAHEIMQFRAMPDLSGTLVEYKATL